MYHHQNGLKVDKAAKETVVAGLAEIWMLSAEEEQT